MEWDVFTDIVVLLLNTPAFQNFLGSLDASGQAGAQLNSGPLNPAFAGVKIYFAYCLNAPFDFSSNPEVIEIVP